MSIMREQRPKLIGDGTSTSTGENVRPERDDVTARKRAPETSASGAGMISLISGYAAVLVDGLDLAWAQRRISATRVHPRLFAEPAQSFAVVALQPKERGLGAVVRPDDVLVFDHGAVLRLAPATDMRHDLLALGSVNRDLGATPNARRTA